MMENQQMITCGFIGEQDVGKTSLINKFFRHAEIAAYNPTIAVEISYACFQLQDGTMVRVKCWDTSGENKYKNMVCYHLKGADVVVIVFDLTNLASFKKISEWVQRLKKENVYPKVLYLVGNKADLIKLDSSLRRVSVKQGQQQAKQISARYAQISVKSDSQFQFLSEALSNVMADRAQKQIQLKSMKTNLDMVDMTNAQKNSVDSPCQCDIF